ncbi:hypothetical protein GXP67_05510 [Rhodocytophaga rosea]|uniref:Lipoprotein n=1 Tax=Rhodocytophaga rosea TaxID=2704465 RepID=A0A6C0GEG5_9BACT|nr:hypothetical protein [Rhodocytophaga rosea]QHT66163.1 hypothetical protein GXP67_05510 [Rhodocytophaga rosea]
MKKRTYKVLLGLVLILLASCEKKTAEPEITCPELYFYDNGQKVKLDLYLDKIFVTFKNANGYAEKNEAIAQFNVLQKVEVADEIQCGACSVPRLSHSTDCKQVYKAITTLHQSPEVIYTSPCVMSRDGSIKIVTDYFLVKLKATTSQEEVNSLLQEYGIIGKHGFYDNSLEGGFQVDKTSKANALEMANLFYETGKFEYCIPHFIEWHK